MIEEGRDRIWYGKSVSRTGTPPRFIVRKIAARPVLRNLVDVRVCTERQVNRLTQTCREVCWRELLQGFRIRRSPMDAVAHDRTRSTTDGEVCRWGFTVVIGTRGRFGIYIEVGICPRLYTVLIYVVPDFC